MKRKEVLVYRKYDNIKAVAIYSVDENEEFVLSEGVYLTELLPEDKTTWFKYPRTKYGNVRNTSYCIYHTLNEMVEDKWIILEK